MSIYTEINKAWATLFGFKVENDEASFNDKPLYWNNNAVANWDDLLSAKPSDLKQSAGFAEVPNTKTYDELMTAENFSYGVFDWTNEHGTRLGFSLGQAFINDFLGSESLFNCMNYGVNASGSIDNYGLGYSANSPTQLNGEQDHIGFYWEYGSVSIDEVVIYDETPHYACCYCLAEVNGFYNQPVALLITYENNTQYLYSYRATGSSNWIDFDLSQADNVSVVYFDDGKNLPDGIEWNTELASYFVPKVKETETTTILTQTTATQAMLGAQIMTHVTVWGMGIGCACFIAALVKFMGRCFSRR